MAEKKPKPETKRSIDKQIKRDARNNNIERSREKAVEQGGTFKVGRRGEYKRKL